LLHFDVTFSHTIKGQYSWGFLALLQYFLLKSPPSGGEANQSRDREGAELERCSVGASEPLLTIKVNKGKSNQMKPNQGKKPNQIEPFRTFPNLSEPKSIFG